MNDKQDYGAEQLFIGILLLVAGYTSNANGAFLVAIFGGFLTVIKLIHLYIWLKGELK